MILSGHFWLAHNWKYHADEKVARSGFQPGFRAIKNVLGYV